MAEGYAHRRYGHILCDRKKCFRHIYGKTTGHLIIDGFIHIAYGTDFYPAGDSGCHKAGKWMDHLLRISSFIGNAMPNFFVAILLMELLSIKLGWLPVIASDVSFQSAIMPTLTLAISMSGKIYAAGAGDCSGGIEQRLCHRT